MTDDGTDRAGSKKATPYCRRPEGPVPESVNKLEQLSYETG
jgi:hypothetical protein